MPPLINYDSPNELKAFLKTRSLGMRKKFGQNFLINRTAREKLLDALGLYEGVSVWEIGPGLGSMTEGLIKRGAKVTAFEIDTAFIFALKEFFAHEREGTHPAFNLIEGDVLKTWPLVNAGVFFPAKELFLLGNLPYNIAAALLAGFIEKGRFFKRMVITVQKEVALRMAALPGTVDYSSFSVLCSSVYKISLINLIKSSSFYPVPKVDSYGVRMDLLEKKEKPPLLFYPLVRGLFSNRRKMIKNTLSSFASSVIVNTKLSTSSNEIAAAILKSAGISGDRRPETLSVNEFTTLAVYLEELISGER